MPAPLRCRSALCALAAALAVGAAPAPAAAPPQARVGTGALEGRAEQTDGIALQVFRGIPYAAAPVGALRWRPPQPAQPWPGVRAATRFGPRCMQRRLFGDMVFRSDGMSEDCLYLNVWAPMAKTAKPKPVLVYFYGGGFVAGDGSEPRYDGAHMAARGVVAVTVNYRLGVFGFLALPALAAESPQHATGNYGLLDQVAALRWVRANIARFGGDPQRITIAGESAGSISVSALMASPRSRGLIAGAIGESGALIAPIAPAPRERAEREGQRFAQLVGAGSLAALRAMPAKALLDATGTKGAPPFDPDIDGDFLAEAPAAIYARGEQAHVPLLLGSNSQEGFWPAILGTRAPTPENYAAALRERFGARAARLLELYPGGDQAQVRASATALAGDLFIAHSTWRWMDLQRRTGQAPVYYYSYAHPRPAKRQPKPGERPDPGAVHSGEIEYALGNLDGNPVYAWNAGDRAVSKTLTGYFANFIRNGDPNGPGLPAWPPAERADGGVARQVIDVHTRAGIDRGGPRQRYLQRLFAAPPATP